MKIAIAAATGNIGSRTAREIAAASKAEIVLLGRDAKKLRALEISNAVCCAVDLSDADAVTKAISGTDALLWIVPPASHYPSLKEWYEKVVAAGVAAVQANRIKRVVAVSSVGAGSRAGLGTVSYVGEMELAFTKLDTNFVALRPGYFMENFLQQADRIKNHDYFAFTFAPYHDIPFISTDDIGDIAAGYLLDDKWAGKWTRDLLGSRNLTLTEVAATLSQTLGRRINYRQESFAAAEQNLAQANLPETVRRELLELFSALGDPNGIYATARTHETATPTTFEQFVKSKLLPKLR